MQALFIFDWKHKVISIYEYFLIIKPGVSHHYHLQTTFIKFNACQKVSMVWKIKAQKRNLLCISKCPKTNRFTKERILMI